MIETFPVVLVGRQRLDISPRQIGTDTPSAEDDSIIERSSQLRVAHSHQCVPVRDADLKRLDRRNFRPRDG
jgi:hypothetical protein